MHLYHHAPGVPPPSQYQHHWVSLLGGEVERRSSQRWQREVWRSRRAARRRSAGGSGNITPHGSAGAVGAHHCDDPNQERERHRQHGDAWQQSTRWTTLCGARRSLLPFLHMRPAPVLLDRLRDAGGDECAMIVSFPLYLSSAPMGRCGFLVSHPCGYARASHSRARCSALPVPAHPSGDGITTRLMPRRKRRV